MSVILTQKYAYIIEEKGFKRFLYLIVSIFPLLKDIVKSGKHRELVSFSIWEILYGLKFYSKKSVVKFDDFKPFVLNDETDIKKVRFDISKSSFEIKKSSFDWKVRFVDKDGDIYGTLADNDKVFYKKAKNANEVERLYIFEDIVNSLFISGKGTILVCSCGNLYRSEDRGRTFKRVLSLTNPKNPQSYIFHTNGFTHCGEEVILVGEYGNVAKDGRWMNVANIYKSVDDGRQWQKSEFLKNMGINKHVHMIKYSEVLKRVFLTDGDNLKKLWISTKEGDFDHNKEWRLINRFHIQMGGYTSLCEVDDTVFLGTDYLGGTNFIVSTKDGENFVKKVIPDPYRRSPVMNLQTLSFAKESLIWAILHNPISSKTKCLLMCSDNGAKSWKRVIEYDGTIFEIELNSDREKKDESITFLLTDKRENAATCFEISKRATSD